MEDLDEIKKYIFNYNPDGLILDTNILILLLIGNYDKNLIETYPPLTDTGKSYTVDDFKVLSEILGFFKTLVITPQILSELSSLVIKPTNGLYDAVRDKYISSIVARLRNSQERFHKSRFLWDLEIKILRDYGFTDMNLIGLSKNKKLPILTDDLPFYIYAQQTIPIMNYQTIKYAYLRDFLKK